MYQLLGIVHLCRASCQTSQGINKRAENISKCDFLGKTLCNKFYHLKN